MKRVFLFFGTLLLTHSLLAQDIFKEHGFDKEVLTLSRGRYEEIFTNSEIVQIGSVLLNTKTNKIVEFLDEEEADSSLFDVEYSSRWLSVDPLAEKYPEYSPYVYCKNNPVIYIDPDGRFPIGIHSEMVFKAFSKTKISRESVQYMSISASLFADAFSKENLHLDNMSDFKSIAGGYILAKYTIIKGLKTEDFIGAGLGLHTIGDFYSHSNYIQLYKKYADENGLSMDINDIPTFAEAMANPDLKGFQDVLKKELKTGTFGEGNVLIELYKDKKSTDKNSHGQMSLDTPNSSKGSESYNNNGDTMYDAAYATALKDITGTATRLAGEE